MSNYDASQAKLKEKIAVLNDIRSNFDIDPEMYDKLRIAIKYDCSKNYTDTKEFLEELPQRLRAELAMLIHRDIYTNFPYFFGKDKIFIAWIGPKLKGMIVSDLEYIYKEGDDICEVYFL